MINFQLRSYIQALEQLDIARVRARSRDPNEIVPNDIKHLIHSDVQTIGSYCESLWLPTAMHRASRLTVALGTTATYETILREIEELWNALDHDSYEQFFYHYPTERLPYLRQYKVEWKLPLEAFPSIEPEIEAGVDCYALTHNTSCVFHMVRIAEVGLRTIGRERGVKKVRKKVPIDWGTWGDVLKGIEPAIDQIRRKANGPKNKPL
jgi:hypothetical protein